VIESEHVRARRVLARRRPALMAIAEALIAKETLEREELDAIVREAEPGEEPEHDDAGERAEDDAAPRLVRPRPRRPAAT
jgi:hypothetical protein